MVNHKFKYLYRDAGNYKEYGSVIFSNPDNMLPETAEKILRECFLEGCLFIADQLGIANHFLYIRGDASSDDHCFHEFEHVEATLEPPNDSMGRSITRFIRTVKRQSSRGWNVFDPHSIEDFHPAGF